MRPLRLIARLDIKGPHLIKGVHLEGLRKVGDPHEHAVRYADAGVDEILYLDIVASLYERFSLADLVRRTAENVFVPITVGGGLRNLEDVRLALKSGADKVAINTAAIRRPGFINEVVHEFGSQCLVVSIEAKRQPKGGWHCYTDSGREVTGRPVVEWSQEAVERGAGEILLTSIDTEGTLRGLDAALVREVSGATPRPLIASGGVGGRTHVTEGIAAGADAIAVAHVLHYNTESVAELRSALIASPPFHRSV
ncbi:MAG: imidazole glycerol phosphate synthase cyclase subunit [Fimbriimonadaceae bacterium]|nr:imidazole glycerol phosphate synthase cyclase subunit [Fimbriimonadaceae bacterium]